MPAHLIQLLLTIPGALICRSAKTHHKADGDKLLTKVPSSKFGKSVDCIITTNAGLPDTRSQPKTNDLITGDLRAHADRSDSHPRINCQVVAHAALKTIDAYDGSSR